VSTRRRMNLFDVSKHCPLPQFASLLLDFAASSDRTLDVDCAGRDHYIGRTPA
jgi:hypothetical protein